MFTGELNIEQIDGKIDRGQKKRYRQMKRANNNVNYCEEKSQKMIEKKR